MKKKKLYILILLVLGVGIYYLILTYWFYWNEPQFEKPECKVNNRDSFKYLKPTVSYQLKIKESKFENLKMIGNVDVVGVRGKNAQERLYGMILRTLRFQNITSKVEKKYGLPKNLLLAMVMQESGGVDLLPNSSDDGGLGLCHMQGYMAQLFGLKTYENCNEIICKTHGIELRRLIAKYNQDRRLLISFDERFNPVLNLDAAGRMLAYYAAGPKVKGTPVRTALYGYAGSKNYSKYYKRVMKYYTILQDSTIFKNIENEFNRRNNSFKINGILANFNDYISYHQEQNKNYGLDDYK